MTKVQLSILMILSAITFGACQSVEQISIDYLLPAEISFPSELRKVAIVNNMSETPDNTISQIPDLKKSERGEIKRALSYGNGDPKITTETLAEEIAKQNYFDEVVVCDSALRAHDHFVRESTLGQDEVEQLVSDLKVDFLIAVENVQLRARTILAYNREFDFYKGTVDVTVIPTLRVYTPNRSTSAATLQLSDSIFWAGYGDTEAYAISQIIPVKEMVKEASNFAGTFPVTKLIPHWETGTRVLFVNGGVAFRDAAVYIRRNSWDKALKLWEEAYYKYKSEKKRMKAAMNMALCYEMNDKIEEAYSWAVKAQEAARKADKISDTESNITSSERVSDFLMTSLYVSELGKRMEGLPQLRMQMQRFGTDF